MPGIGRYEPGNWLPLAAMSVEDEGAFAELMADPALDKSLFLFVDQGRYGGQLCSAFASLDRAITDHTGKTGVGEQFVAITLRGSEMAAMAREEKFRALLLDDPHSPGDFAILGYAGMAPATFAGANVEALLERAGRMACNASGCNCPVDGDNIGAQVGTALGTLAAEGRIRPTFIASAALLPLATWLAQFLAGSTQRRLQPLVHEIVALPAAYGDDHVFIHLRLDGDESHDDAIQELLTEGHPVIEIRLKDLHDLGAQLFFWQIVIAVAAYHLGVNPFQGISEQTEIKLAPAL
jgi:hypothetical protein